MLKVLSPTIHGALDYGLALAFLFLPGVLGFGNTAANVSQAIGLAYLAVSLLTRYPLGALKLIPFPLHGAIETALALAWIAMPWLLDFSEDLAARLFFVVAGVGLLSVAALTDYRGAGASAYSGEERRRRADRRRHALPVGMDRRVNRDADRRYAGA
jgi:hypothetical protein